MTVQLSLRWDLRQYKNATNSEAETGSVYSLTRGGRVLRPVLLTTKPQTLQRRGKRSPCGYYNCILNSKSILKKKKRTLTEKAQDYFRGGGLVVT